MLISIIFVTIWPFRQCFFVSHVVRARTLQNTDARLTFRDCRDCRIVTTIRSLLVHSIFDLDTCWRWYTKSGRTEVVSQGDANIYPIHRTLSHCCSGFCCLVLRSFLHSCCFINNYAFSYHHVMQTAYHFNNHSAAPTFLASSQ